MSICHHLCQAIDKQAFKGRHKQPAAPSEASSSRQPAAGSKRKAAEPSSSPEAARVGAAPEDVPVDSMAIKVHQALMTWPEPLQYMAEQAAAVLHIPPVTLM